MTRRAQLSIAALVFAATVFGAPGEALAEVSARRERDRVHTTIFSDVVQSIADDPDPIPTVLWQPYGAQTTRRTVNPSGDLRPDGAPHVAFHPTSGWPFVVWAYNNGADHDIAYARWLGETWSEIQYLTASVADELDPEAVVAPDGTVHIVWWIDGADPHVVTASLGPTDTDFAATTRVSPLAESAARPSVAIAGGTVWVAYERLLDSVLPPEGASSSPAVVKQVTVNRELAGGGFERALTIDSARGAALDIELHAQPGHLWIEWKSSDTQFGYTGANTGGWSAVGSVAWSDPSWIGQEDVRQTVRRLVLQPGVSPIDPSE